MKVVWGYVVYDYLRYDFGFGVLAVWFSKLVVHLCFVSVFVVACVGFWRFGFFLSGFCEINPRKYGCIWFLDDRACFLSFLGTNCLVILLGFLVLGRWPCLNQYHMTIALLRIVLWKSVVWSWMSRSLHLLSWWFSDMAIGFLVILVELYSMIPY